MIPETDEQRIALFKDNKLRLLASLIDFVRLGDLDDPDASWVIPSTTTAAQLASSLDLIKKFEFDPPSYEDGKAAIDFVRSKATAERAGRTKAAYDNDSQDSEEEEFIFPVGGPTNVRRDALEDLKKIRRFRRRRGDSSEGDEEEMERKSEERRTKRRDAELEKRRKIKSDLFVHDSDEEEDEERDRQFFEKEAAVRRETADVVARALMQIRKVANIEEKPRKRSIEKGKASRRKKRKMADDRQDEESEVGDGDDLNELVINSSRSSSMDSEDRMIIDGDNDMEHATDTPISSQQILLDRDEKEQSASDSKKNMKARSPAQESEDEVGMALHEPMRRTIRAGFIVDSDSDE